jgi:hypothetical protein
MWRKLSAVLSSALLVTLITLTASSAFAQRQTPPPYEGPFVNVRGAFVTPIPGQPLTAVVEITSTQTLSNGFTESEHTFRNIARDSQGRIYNERRLLVGDSFKGDPPRLGFHIFDPVAKLNTFLDPATHLARQSNWTAPPTLTEPGDTAPVAPRDPLVAQEDMGTQTMENVSVRGTRKTTTIPASASGTGKSIQVIDEIWYSDELRLNMLVRHTDPRSGQQIVTITHVDRAEPAHTWFEIPPNYKIVDENPVP